jgi:hypothetical protein
MGYRPEDIDLFALIRDKTRLEGTAYFELHAGELPEPEACWLEGSLFIRDAAFDFFVECFHRSNPGFDYFAFERFEPPQIELLIEELSLLLSELAPRCSRDVVFSRYNSLFDRKIWDGVDTEALRSAVVSASEGILTFTRQARSDNRCMWVLGM